MDGTLYLPQVSRNSFSTNSKPYMFTMMRQALGIEDKKTDILSHVESLDPEKKVKANTDLIEIEKLAMNRMIPQPGLEELFHFLHKDDAPIVKRSFFPLKPAVEPSHHIAQTWGVDPASLMMVGDSVDDMVGGIKAGFGAVVLIKHDNNLHLLEKEGLGEYIDKDITTLDELVQMVEEGIEVRDKSDFKGYGMYR